MKINVGRTLKNLRKSHQIKQYELAKDLDITPTHLSLIEANKSKVSIEILFKLEKIIKISPTVFMIKAIKNSKIKGYPSLYDEMLRYFSKTYKP